MAAPFDATEVSEHRSSADASHLLRLAEQVGIVSQELKAVRIQCAEALQELEARFPRPRMVDFFCGGGGASLGFRSAGINVVAGIEWDERICEAARLNLDHEIIEADIGRIDEALARQIAAVCRPDIVHGSPPCQDMSAMGKGGLGERAMLTVHYARLVAWMQPQIFSMENVLQLYTTAKPIWSEAKAILRAAGYGMVELKLHAQNHQAATLRKRAFVIGVRGASDRSLGALKRKLWHDKVYLTHTIRDALGDIGCGGLWHHRGSVKSHGILGPDEAYPTLRASQSVAMPPDYRARKGDACPPDQARSPSWAEYLRLQTFPADYRFHDAMPGYYRMRIVGNSVPPAMSADVGRWLVTLWKAINSIG